MALHADIDTYLMQGYWVFRGIVPPALLRDLRRQSDKARAMAHEINGPQAQRLQPLVKYDDQLDIQPFKDYAELAPLRDAVTALLGPGYTHAHMDFMGLLVEPAERPWHCGWHRDGIVEVRRDLRTPEILEAMKVFWHDLRVFNQVNCALYADSCTWFVPGSHLRFHDLPNEIETTADSVRPPAEMSIAEAERHCLAHCQSMPGAQQIHLQAGDFMVYRNLAWHCGCYLPYQPRATIHDVVSHEDGSEIYAHWRTTQAAARAAKA